MFEYFLILALLFIYVLIIGVICKEPLKEEPPVKEFPTPEIVSEGAENTTSVQPSGETTTTSEAEIQQICSANLVPSEDVNQNNEGVQLESDLIKLAIFLAKRGIYPNGVNCIVSEATLPSTTYAVDVLSNIYKSLFLNPQTTIDELNGFNNIECYICGILDKSELIGNNCDEYTDMAKFIYSAFSTPGVDYYINILQTLILFAIIAARIDDSAACFGAIRILYTRCLVLSMHNSTDDYSIAEGNLIGFQNDSSLAIIPPIVKNLSLHSFKFNIGLETIIIPSSVEHIAADAFTNLKTLLVVNYEGERLKKDLDNCILPQYAKYVQYGKNNLSIAATCKQEDLQANSLPNLSIKNSIELAFPDVNCTSESVDNNDLIDKDDFVEVSFYKGVDVGAWTHSMFFQFREGKNGLSLKLIVEEVYSSREKEWSKIIEKCTAFSNIFTFSIVAFSGCDSKYVVIEHKFTSTEAKNAGDTAVNLTLDATNNVLPYFYKTKDEMLRSF